MCRQLSMSKTGMLMCKNLIAVVYELDEVKIYYEMESILICDIFIHLIVFYEWIKGSDCALSVIQNC